MCNCPTCGKPFSKPVIPAKTAPLSAEQIAIAKKAIIELADAWNREGTTMVSFHPVTNGVSPILVFTGEEWVAFDLTYVDSGSNWGWDNSYHQEWESEE